MRSSFIDPGRLRTELQLEAAQSQTDDSGGQIETWNEVASVLAHVEPVGADDFFGADQRMQRITHRVTMRFRDDVRAGQRLVRNGRKLRIVTAHDPDETGRYLVCRTVEELQ